MPEPDTRASIADWLWAEAKDLDLDSFDGSVILVAAGSPGAGLAAALNEGHPGKFTVIEAGPHLGSVFAAYGADALARSIAPPVELPVGVVTALVGVPLFAVLLRRRLA